VVGHALEASGMTSLAAGSRHPVGDSHELSAVVGDQWATGVSAAGALAVDYADADNVVAHGTASVVLDTLRVVDDLEVHTLHVVGQRAASMVLVWYKEGGMGAWESEWGSRAGDAS